MKGRTKERLAKATGKSQATFERNAAFTRGVDALDEAVPGTKA